MGEERSPEDGKLAELAVFTSDSEAEAAATFLTEEGIPFEFRGGIPNMGSLTLLVPREIRIFVDSSDLERATEVLLALRSESVDRPFRGAAPRGEAPDHDSTTGMREKTPWFAFFLAFIVPFSGGHLYGRHHWTAVILLLGKVLMLAQVDLTGILLITLADGVFGTFATKRCIKGEIAPPLRQIAVGLTIVFVVYYFGRRLEGAPA